ncbi:hypothetical protein A2U01_0026133, partial [Trifolium medium]|nr:hypothetical protein [Trifolium medium]
MGQLSALKSIPNRWMSRACSAIELSRRVKIRDTNVAKCFTLENSEEYNTR